jgi:hypothetical protein
LIFPPISFFIGLAQAAGALTGSPAEMQPTSAPLAAEAADSPPGDQDRHGARWKGLRTAARGTPLSRISTPEHETPARVLATGSTSASAGRNLKPPAGTILRSHPQDPMFGPSAGEGAQLERRRAPTVTPCGPTGGGPGLARQDRRLGGGPGGTLACKLVTVAAGSSARFRTSLHSTSNLFERDRMPGRLESRVKLPGVGGIGVSEALQRRGRRGRDATTATRTRSQTSESQHEDSEVGHWKQEEAHRG